MKKFLSVLIVMLLLSSGAMAAARIPVYRVGSAFLFFEKSTGEINGFAGEPQSLAIPSTIAGYKVTSIGDNAFQGCVSLRSVEIPDTVNHIGSGAFRGCTDLTQVTFLGTVENVPLNAFENTPWAQGTGEEFVIAGRTLLLKYNGYANEIAVPDGVQVIAHDAFAQNIYLQRVTLPEGLIEIGDNAFMHCENLRELNFPSTLSYVGIGAFDGTLWLRSQGGEFVHANNILVAYNGEGGSVTVPEGITSLGSGAFMSNDKIVVVSLPKTIKTINEAAFGESKSLKTVIIPSSVEWIDEYAFSGSESVVIFGDPGSYSEYYARISGLAFSSPINIKVNGNIVYYDVPSIVIGENTYAPMRATLEALGLRVDWDDGTVLAENSEVSLTARVGSTDVEVDGVEETISAPLIIIDGRVMLPVRDFARLIGAEVKWDGETRTVMLEA